MSTGTAQSMMHDEAFNRGCDARLRGDSTDCNQHIDQRLREYWLQGYRDVDREWGRLDPRARPLPAVRERHG